MENFYKLSAFEIREKILKVFINYLPLKLEKRF